MGIAGLQTAAGGLALPKEEVSGFLLRTAAEALAYFKKYE